MSSNGALPPRYARSTPRDAPSSRVSAPGTLPPTYTEASRPSRADAYDHSPPRSDEKSTKGSSKQRVPCPPHLKVHSTVEDNNLILLSPEGLPIYVVDNTTSLSQTMVRSGGKGGPVVSTASSAGPFLKEMMIEYESRVKSGTHSTTIVASGRFTAVWEFTFKAKSFEWKHHKGSWILKQDHTQIATYHVGESFDIDPDHVDMADVIVSTVFATDLFARLSAERRKRALNSITGKSTSGMLGGGLLL